MLNTSIKAMMAVGALVSIAGCKSTIESYVEDEVGDRLNEMAGDRLYLAHGDTTLNGRVRTASMSTDGEGNVTGGRLGAARNGSIEVGTNIGELETLEMTNGSTTTRFGAGGDRIDDGMDSLLITARNSNGKKRSWMGNADALDYDHQTFGMWATGVGTSNGSVSVGSFGRRTASADVPTSGSATYSGRSVGMVVTTDGRALVSESQVGVTTSDFSNVSVASTNTYVRNLSGGNAWRGQHLDFAGTGTISGNEFTANINGVIPFSAGDSGTLNGAFYGDNAEEVGGTFEMNGAIGNYSGAFGGN
ncbi:MAG: transferrin-binding protein-like solute binding protein [Shimia sp.]|uniref:transferrin-binding protein-like solute binding protein n=1 Tax=Shimia sp. TaxID=1954381 RepID=UPI0025E3D06F|nr:transferrin-binding protein-like solute binding protein [Shimia sp.]MCH2068926.1 transferrin-binding protein-like solute binding protein [Shimia sp.]